MLPRDKIRPVIKVCDDRMIVSLNKNSTLKDGTFAIRKAIDIFYRRKAEEVIYDRLEFFNEHYNFKYNRVTLRDQKTRWGSCSSASNLNFNWRLIMAPIEVIDYVVVHELCHLREMNHSGNYWRLVEETIPDHKKMRKWLKDYQYLLMF